MVDRWNCAPMSDAKPTQDGGMVYYVDYERLAKALEHINMLACYASEENTDSRETALLEIGRVARGEDRHEGPEFADGPEFEGWGQRSTDSGGSEHGS